MKTTPTSTTRFIAFSLAFLAFANAQSPPYQLLVPNSEFHGFGEPGKGRKKIFISGDIAHPGDYYVQDHTNLYAILQRIGQCGHSSEGLIKKILVILEDGTRIQCSLKDLKPSDPPLAKDIEIIYVPEIVS